MWFERTIVERLLANVVRSEEGSAFFLAQAAEAEAAGEALVFQRLEDHAPERLKRLIARHHDDERHHAGLLRDAALGFGGAWPAFSPDLNMVHVLDRALGGPLLSGPIRSDRAAIEIYLIMELLERRAAREIGLLGDAMERAGRPAYHMLHRVSVDEARHVRYCRAALRLYGHPLTAEAAPPSAYERELRTEVDRAFDLYDLATLSHLLDTGLLGVGLGSFERTAWHSLARGLALTIGLRRRRAPRGPAQLLSEATCSDHS